MNLEKEFNKAKKDDKNKLILMTALSAVVGLVILYVIYYLWNYLAPVWGLPNLTYLQFLGTVFFINIIQQFLGIRKFPSNV